MICPRRDGPLYGEGGSLTELHLTATLSVPRRAVGMLVAVQARGTGRPSLLQRTVADSLRGIGLGACLVDLVAPSEASEEQKRTDVDLLTERLEQVIEYLGVHPQTWHLPVGILGTGLAAAAAMTLAAERPELMQMVISCFGRPDLAVTSPAKITVPTLLISPSRNIRLLELNESVFLELRCESQLAIVTPTARQLTESDVLASCAPIIRQWCERRMGVPDRDFRRSAQTRGRNKADAAE
jgi:putative phosphoribosyl transferase